jgi:DNA-binding XRE family transcriptional regulator
MVNSADFSKRLQKIMDRNDLNASSFAERIHVGRSSISHILSGRNKPSLDFVVNTVKEFPEVDLYWLLNGNGTYPKTEMPQASNPTGSYSTSIPQDKKGDPSLSENEKIPFKIKSVEGKNIQKIILLYNDGSFEYFIP